MDTFQPLPRRTLPPLNSSRSGNTVSKNLLDEAGKPRPLPKSTDNFSQSKGFRNSNDIELLDTNNQSVNNGTGEDGANQTSELSLTRRSRPKRRQIRESQNQVLRDDVVENGHALTNMISEEDIIPVDRIENEGGISALPGVTNNVGNSKPQDKVYIQTASGFTSRHTDWVASRQVGVTNLEISNITDSNFATKTTDVALSFHKVFMFISFLLHGLLGGICIWQIIFPFSLNASGDANFISQYFSLAQPIQTTLYILLIFCLLSALDRYNFAKPKQNFLWRLLKFQTSAWLTLVYFVSFMITIGMGAIDFWLANIAPIRDNPDVADAYFNSDVSGTVRTWLALNVVRNVFAILGWFIVSVRPTEDNTAENLFASNEEFIG